MEPRFQERTQGGRRTRWHAVAVLTGLLVSVGLGARGQVCAPEVLFSSPDTGDAARAALLQAIQGSKSTLCLAASTLTDPALGDAVARASRRGVAVRLILPREAASELGSQYPRLVTAGVPVGLAPDGTGFFHRFAVIDATVVVTGSYALSERTGTTSYDSLVIIRCPAGSGTVAQRFTQEFDHLWERCTRETPPGEGSARFPLAGVLLGQVDRAAQCVELLNVSSVPVDLSGWALGDLEGRYVFPQGTTLAPGDPYRLCGDTLNPTHDLHALYLDPAHDELFLVDPNGTIVDESVW